LRNYFYCVRHIDYFWVRNYFDCVHHAACFHISLAAPELSLPLPRVNYYLPSPHPTFRTAPLHHYSGYTQYSGLCHYIVAKNIFGYHVYSHRERWVF
jgi:hypothetical protein